MSDKQQAVIEIALANGGVAIIDAPDAPIVAGRRWRAWRSGKNWYAASSWREGGVRKFLLMHRLILGLPQGVGTDHKDGNGLNNRRSNLRPCTQKQNSGNSRKRGGSSRFKGVTWHKRDRRWRAQIWRNGKRTFLISTRSEEEAARAYDSAARNIYGEFALLNFPSATESKR